MIRRGNKSQDGLLASKLSGGKKDFDWSQLNPMEWEFLGGDRKMDIPGAWQNIKDAWGSDGDDSMVRDYTQAGGDAGGLEELYKQQGPSGPLDAGSRMAGPELPSESGEAVEMPEFAKSQMKTYKDPEISGRQEEEKRMLARMALAQQTPSLAPPEAGMLASLLGQDKDSGLAHAGGAMAETPSFPSEPAAVAQQPVRSHHISAAEQVTGSPHDGTEQTPSLLAAQTGTGDHVGVDPEEGEGLMAKLGGLMSSDSSKTKPLSKSKQAGIKIATDLLTGGNRNTPIQKAPSAGVKMGRASFPGLLAASQRPVNPRYTPKGLG